MRDRDGMVAWTIQITVLIDSTHRVSLTGEAQKARQFYAAPSNSAIDQM
jgi:hypothetical protein